jgi:hypothetical protein
MFVANARSLTLERSTVRALVAPALIPNIRQGWKKMKVANTLAHYDMATVTAVNSSRVRAQVQGLAWLNVCHALYGLYCYTA